MPPIEAPSHTNLVRTYPPRRFPSLLLALLILISPNARAVPVYPAPDPSQVTLADTPLVLEAIGLEFFPEAGSNAYTQTLGGLVTSTLALSDNTSSVSVQRRTTSRDDLSLVEIEGSILERALKLPESITGITIDEQVESRSGRFLGRSPAIPAAGRIVRPFYVLLKDETTTPYRGFAVLKLSASDFVLFQLFTDEAHFEKARNTFEIMLTTAKPIETEALNSELAEAVRAGVERLASLSPQAYDDVVNDFPDQFERIYRPAPGGAQADEKEVGYRRVRAWIGSKSDLTDAKPHHDGKGDGYILRIDGLVLLDDGRRADSRGVYYLSRDRRQEAWSVTMAIRSENAEPEIWNELGARAGNSMSVQINEAGRSTRTFRPAIEGEGYISRLESYLLPQLLIRAGQPGKYAFYTYDQSAESNRLRRVELVKAPDRPDVWRVTIRQIDESFETSDYNRFGRLIRAETSDGLMKRPIEFDRLYKIWESKGLPLD